MFQFTSQNDVRELQARLWWGNEFHSVGATTVNALSPHDLEDVFTAGRFLLMERKPEPDRERDGL